jgi:thiosulfate dehydrogenase [quinone] large subunit
MRINRQATAYLLLRVTVGVNFLLHGVSRLLADHAIFAAYLDKQMHATIIPASLVHLVAVVLPWCEATVGFLLLLGLLTPVVLIAASLLMLLLQTGVCLAQNWEAAGSQLIYVLLLFILLTWSDRNRYSLDSFIYKSSAKI